MPRYSIRERTIFDLCDEEAVPEADGSPGAISSFRERETAESELARHEQLVKDAEVVEDGAQAQEER